MNTLKQKTAGKLSALVAQLYPGAALSPDDLAGMLEFPPDPAMGDLALPCFKLSRSLHASPVAIADALAPKMAGGEIARAEAVKGYLNFFVDGAAFSARVLSEIAEKGDKYGSPECGAGKTVVLDYSSPNVAKPFHIGHLGTTVIGHSLKLLHQFAGYHCIGINHLGDWGTQFGKMIVAYRKWGNREAVEEGECDELVRLYVRFHAEAEKDETLIDQARAETKKLEEHDPDNLALWKWFIEISLREYQKTYRQLGITFDSYNGESFYTDKMPEQVELLKKKGLLTLDDGASVVRLDQFNMPVCLILRSDGTTLYPTRDIAAAVYRARTYHFDKCIYVTSAGQSLHFAQWFKVVELMGYDWYDKLVHVPYGTVSINGEKLATRTGNVVLLKDLFSEAIEKVKKISAEKNGGTPCSDEIAEAVGVGAVVFHYLSNNRMRDINFILEDALSFDGNTGPYAQYTYARTCSVLAKAGNRGNFTGGELNDAEILLAKTLSTFPDRVRAALDGYEPSEITRFILDLCAAYNRFYHDCPIVTAEDEREKNNRVALTSAVNTVLGRALSLICLKTPEKI